MTESRIIPGWAQDVIANPKATVEELRQAFAAEVTIPDAPCYLLKDRVGYRGQKYEVRFTDADGKECVFGWQNESSGGLANSAKLHPGWSNVRVIPIAETSLSPKEGK